MFSDYEFLIIAKKSNSFSSEQVNKLKTELKWLKQSFDIKPPLFDIDFGIASVEKFKFTPPTLWAFEVKTLWILMFFGKDARKLLSEINLNNLDFGNLNELIIIRFWNMLLHISENVLRDSASQYEQFVTKFYYCRNILDIITIYLPNKGYLIGGYENRLEIFNNDQSEMWQGLKDKFVKAHDFKLNLIDKITDKEAQVGFFNGFISLARFIDSGLEEKVFINTSKDLTEILNQLHGTAIFNEKMIRRLRRNYMELKIFLNFLKSGLGLIKSTKWLLTDIRFDMFAFLAHMHFAHINPTFRKKSLVIAVDHLNKFH